MDRQADVRSGGPEIADHHTLSVEESLERLGVDVEVGLSDQEAHARLQRHGRNRLAEARQRGPLAILLEQFKSTVLIILGIAAALAAAFKEWAEAIAILAVLLINATIGFVSEWKAVRSMEALRKMGQPTARVRRNGKEREIETELIVPGDVVLLEAGDVVPADLRIVESNGLRADEAPLTGESVSVVKTIDAVDSDAGIADRVGMLFMGTTVSDGSGVGVVVATGASTELGRIAELAAKAEESTTPLQQRLDRLGRILAVITVAIAVVVGVAGLLAGRDRSLMIQTALALGVAAIPEGLPIVSTIALARGMWIMARRQALINRLPAVETLGATRVIFTDKTGTLTENRMAVRVVVTPDGEHELQAHDPVEAQRIDKRDPAGFDDALVLRVVEVGVLCSNAVLTDVDEDGIPDEEQGDPTEVAILKAGLNLGVNRPTLLDSRPELREEPFRSETMMMATYHESDGGIEVAVKGAPQSVIEACDRVATSDDGEKPMNDRARQEWLDRTEELAGRGMRVLAVADKRVTDVQAEPFEGLRLLGLLGMVDPPRDDVQPAIEECHRAGIRVVMVTGDQPATARAIARHVGIVRSDDAPVIHGRELRDPDEMSDAERAHILETNVFARVSPEQKLHLVKLYQERGDTVAMTGDGINDTPALKKADIGIAMGKRGTDAARQAADMVLKDDRFQSIVAAVEQGRAIFSNIRKSVMFMLCTNGAEVLAVALATLVQLPLPLRPLQILYLNVVTDVFPALALGVGKGSGRVMNRPPRPKHESIITRPLWLAIGVWSVLIAACILGAMAAAMEWLGVERERAVTISFLTLAFGKLWFVFNLRDRGTTFLDNDVVRNPWIWGSIAVCIVLLIAAVYLPGLNALLDAANPGLQGWMVVVAFSVVPLFAGQVILAIRKPPPAPEGRTPT